MRPIYGGAGFVAVLPAVSSASRPYGPQYCVAIHKPGAPWRGGYVCMLHASICRTDTAAVRAERAAYALGSLQVRQYALVANP